MTSDSKLMTIYFKDKVNITEVDLLREDSAALYQLIRCCQTNIIEQKAIRIYRNAAVFLHSKLSHVRTVLCMLMVSVTISAYTKGILSHNNGMLHNIT